MKKKICRLLLQTHPEKGHYRIFFFEKRFSPSVCMRPDSFFLLLLFLQKKKDSSNAEALLAYAQFMRTHR